MLERFADLPACDIPAEEARVRRLETVASDVRDRVRNRLRRIYIDARSTVKTMWNSVCP